MFNFQYLKNCFFFSFYCFSINGREVLCSPSDLLSSTVAENFKNIPDFFYGLTASQIDMFMTEDSPIHRQAEKVTEVSYWVFLIGFSKACRYI